MVVVTHPADPMLLLEVALSGNKRGGMFLPASPLLRCSLYSDLKNNIRVDYMYLGSARLIAFLIVFIY